MDNCIVFSLPKSNAFFRFIIGEGDSFFDFIAFENQASPVSFKGTVQQVDLHKLQTSWQSNKTDVKSTDFNDYEQAFFQIQNQIQLGVVSKVILSKLTVKDIKYDNALGYAAQVGFDLMLDDTFFINVDVKRLFLSTDVTVDASNLATGLSIPAEVDINPWLWGFGVGMRF